MNIAAASTELTINGLQTALRSPPATRLAEALRSELGLTGTKVGCDAGDCGACTVLLDGEQVCACMVPVAQVAGRDGAHRRGAGGGKAARCPTLQDGFPPARRGAMRHLHARHADGGADLLGRRTDPGRPRPRRSTRWAACCAAAPAIARSSRPCSMSPEPNGIELRRCRRTRARRSARGCPRPTASPRSTGERDVRRRRRAGRTRYWLRAVRSPHRPCATFDDRRPATTFDAPSRPGIAAVLIAGNDVPGPQRASASIPVIKDQPVLRRRRRQATAARPVLALVGDSRRIGHGDPRRRRADRLAPRAADPRASTAAAAGRGRADRLHAGAEGNVLARGFVKQGRRRGRASPASDIVAEGSISRPASSSTPISSPRPAGRGAIGDRLEIAATTQAPYMDRDEIARVLGLARPRYASSRPAPAAAASAASSTSRSSRCSRSPPGTC